MARIAGVPARAAGRLGRLAYRLVTRRYGALPEPAEIAMHHRRIFWTMGLWELRNERALHVLDPALRDLVFHRVATQIGCSWCIDFGTMLTMRAGADVDRLHRLEDYPTSPAYTDDERAALAYADAMSGTPPTVTDEMVADLERRFGADGVVELTYTVCVEHLRSRFNHALGLTSQGFATACSVPSRG